MNKYPTIWHYEASNNKGTDTSYYVALNDSVWIDVGLDGRATRSDQDTSSIIFAVNR